MAQSDKSHLRVVRSGSDPLGPEPDDAELLDPELLELAGSYDEAGLVTFPVNRLVGSARTSLTLTTQRIVMGDDAIHLVNITGIACSVEVPREGMGVFPRRYLLQIEENRRTHDFSFVDTKADRYILRAGYSALMSPLRPGVLPMIHSDLERRIDAGLPVMIGSVEIAQHGFSIGGLPVTFGFDEYVGCRQQDHLLLVEVSTPRRRTVAEVPMSALNAHILADLLAEQHSRTQEPAS